MTTTNPASRIPPEIWGIIFRDPVIERHDLLALCSIFHPFRVEAEHILYASVKLQKKSQFKSFCFTAASRPHLVQSTRTLTMSIPCQKDRLEAADIAQIATILRLSTNLQHLYIIDVSWKRIAQDRVRTSVIEGHSFKLKTFVNRYFPLAQLGPFLKSQRTIETFIMDCEDTGAPLDWALLPNVKNMSISAESLLGQSGRSDAYYRSVERLQLRIRGTKEEEVLALFTKLKPHLHGKLKSLSISRYQRRRQGMQMAKFISVIAGQFPSLKFLCVRDNLEADTHYRPFLTPLPTDFTRLETLILGPGKIMNGVTAYKELRTDEGRLEAATRIMAAIPTLKRLVLIIGYCHIYDYKRGSNFQVCDMSRKEHFDDNEWLEIE